MPTSHPNELHDRLVTIVRGSAWFMAALTAVRELRLASWCIGAGAVRNLVWDALHELPSASALADVDVTYFDPSALAREHDVALQDQLAIILPGVPWEVTNQAAVHLWFEGYFRHPVPPLLLLEEAVGSWPEYATSVGVVLAADGAINIIAPHGLEDLFNGVVRRNPTRVSIETYRQRVAQKQYAERWPKVRVVLS